MLTPQPLISPVLSLLRCVHQTPRSTLLDAGELKRAFHEAFASLSERALELGWRDSDVHEVIYALVALVDEAIIERGGALSAQWMREQLQLSFFGQATLGEGFFQRLEALRRDPECGPVLLTYWLAMELGFRGAYALHEERSLRELREDIRRELERRGLLEASALSPEVEAPVEAPRARGPERSLFAIGLGALALGIVLDGAFLIDLRLREASVMHATASMHDR